jgi:hypothetical protein
MPFTITTICPGAEEGGSMGNTLIHKPVEEWATIFLDDAAHTKLSFANQ